MVGLACSSRPRLGLEESIAEGLGAQSHHPDGALHLEIPLGEDTHSVPSSVKHPLNSLMECKQEGLVAGQDAEPGLSVSPRILDGQKPLLSFRKSSLKREDFRRRGFPAEISNQPLK